MKKGRQEIELIPYFVCISREAHSVLSLCDCCKFLTTLPPVTVRRDVAGMVSYLEVKMKVKN